MNGQWITTPGTSREKNHYFRARRQFTLDEVPARRQLHIAAESYYRLWVNGREVGRGPARGTRSVNYYDTYDVAPLLQPGVNHLAVLVQCMNIPNFSTFPCRAGLMVELEDRLVSDSAWEVQSARQEWLPEAEVYCLQVGFAEYRDLRLTPEGWQTGHDRSEWTKPEIVTDMDGKKLLPRPVPLLDSVLRRPAEIAHTAQIEPMREDMTAATAITQLRHDHIDGELTARVRPLLLAGDQDVVIQPSPDGADVSLIFNFAAEVIGFFRLELTASAGTIIDLAYDEELDHGRINAARHIYRTADRYVTRAGRQEIGPTLHERGFRYVEVALRNFRGPVTLHRVDATDRRYPFSRIGSFNCNDALLNRVWEVCVETMSACTTDVFNDCPWRERAFWVNDLVVENVVALQAFGDYRLNAHALRLALSNRRPDGLVPGVCPDDDKSRHVLVATNLFLPLMLKDYHLYSGDRATVAELLPTMLEILDLFAGWQDDDRLLNPPAEYWNFIDWSFELNKISLNGKNTALLNWFYIFALNTAAELLEMLGDNDRAAACRARVAPVVEGIEKRFYLPARRCYADWLESDGSASTHASQLTQALAVCSGGTPSARKNELLDSLVSPDLLQPELYLHHFVFNVMRDYGLGTEALSRIRHYWGEMILTGTPTLWESAIHHRGKAAFSNAGSLCHGFGATPINYFQTAVLGIMPLEPGFRRFAVKPEPHDLEFASGRIPTPSGSIVIDWRRDHGKIRVDLTVPFGLTAQTPAGELAAGHHQFEI